MSSLPQWTWVWTSSGSWWWTERPGVLPSMGSQIFRHDWATELNWTEEKEVRWRNFIFFFFKREFFIFETVATVVAKKTQQSQSHRLSHSSTWAYLLQGMWGPSRPEMELMSPAVVDAFLSTEPPAEAWDFISWLCRWWKNCAHVKAHWTVHSTKVHLITCNYFVCSVAQLCPTLWNPMDCSPASSVYEILQASILEWIATSYSRQNWVRKDQLHENLNVWHSNCKIWQRDRCS